MIFNIKYVILKELKRLGDVPQTPHRDLLNMAMEVFDEREKKERMENASHDRQKCKLLVVLRLPPKKM